MGDGEEERVAQGMGAGRVVGLDDAGPALRRQERQGHSIRPLAQQTFLGGPQLLPHTAGCPPRSRLPPTHMAHEASTS